MCCAGRWRRCRTERASAGAKQWRPRRAPPHWRTWAPAHTHCSKSPTGAQSITIHSMPLTQSALRPHCYCPSTAAHALVTLGNCMMFDGPGCFMGRQGGALGFYCRLLTQRMKIPLMRMRICRMRKTHQPSCTALSASPAVPGCPQV